MPIRGFLCPLTLEVVSLEDAPQHFDALRVMPAEAAQGLVEGMEEERRAGPYLSPSILNPAKNCRREILLKKYYAYTREQA